MNRVKRDALLPYAVPRIGTLQSSLRRTFNFSKACFPMNPAGAANFTISRAQSSCSTNVRRSPMICSHRPARCSTQLVEHLRCTIVLATATQPTFDHPELHARGSGLRDVRPIVPLNLDLFARLRRVRVLWPRPNEYLDWDEIAELMIHNQAECRRAALCVVNTRRAARELFQSLKKKYLKDVGLHDEDCVQDAVYHLSTWMCPAHRLQVLDKVRARLDAGTAVLCRLDSTRLKPVSMSIFP